MTTRFIFIGEVSGDRVTREDGGMSWQVEVPALIPTDRMFVRVLSWAEDKVHPEFDDLRGRTIMVTVEAFDTPEDLEARRKAREEEIAANRG